MQQPRALAPLVVGVATVAVLLGGLPAVAAPAAPEDPTLRGPGPAAQARAEQLLDDPARGAVAIRRLGDDLPLAAKRNDLAPGQLRARLREDDTLWVAEDGRLHYIDPLPADPEQGAAQDHQRTGDPASAPAPLAETFRLHSNPGATRVIFIDVDGGTVTGSAWNASYGVATSHPAWDPSGNGPTFDDAERATVQRVWAGMAEDFAPYDVDVTTDDPGLAGILRSDEADQRYGTQVLISPSDDAWSKVCERTCGGIAFLDVFDHVSGGGPHYQPAWVFPQALGTAKNVVEAASHEVGHNLALDHDGLGGEAYYGGHGSWAPIMGVGYSRPISQWSRGDYAGATNDQDDLAVIGGLLDHRQDEAGGPAGAAALPAAGTTQLITSRADVDAYQLGTCAADASVRVVPTADATNLDVRAALLAADGSEVASDDPPSATVDVERASGMDARVTVPTAGAGWVLDVRGTGNGTPSTGYDAYGSVGAYRLETTGCDGVVSGVPARPAGLTVASGSDGTSLEVRWSPPAGGAAVQGYVVSVGDGTPVTLPGDARSRVVTGLDPETPYDVAVAARGAAGQGPAATASARTGPARPPNDDVAGAELLVGAAGTVTGDNAAATAAGDDPAPPGAEIGAGGYSVWYSWTAAGTGPVRFDTESTVTGRDTTLAAYRGSRGALALVAGNDDRPGGGLLSTIEFRATAGETYLLAVDGFATATGSGPFDLVWQEAAAPPEAPTGVTAVRGDQRATVSWTAARTNGSPVTGYTVTAAPGGRTATVAGGLTSAAVSGLTNGTPYRFTVTATSAAGTSVASAPSTPVTPAGVPTPATAVSAARGDGRASITWSPAGANGTPVTGYTVTATPGGRSTTVAGSATGAVVDGLTNGTAYAFAVTATNAVGASAPATTAAVTPAGPPPQMAKPSATGGKRKATVTWSAAADNGAAITGYQVLISPDVVRDVAADKRRLVVRKLRPGRHTVTLVARNELGASPVSPKVRVRVRR